MIKIKVIGAGQAGTKAAIGLIDRGILKGDDVLIVNTTMSDVPPSYRDRAFCFGGGLTEGAGKEREISKQLITDAISSDAVGPVDEFLQGDCDLVMIVSSSEGGTGSGCSSILGRYITEFLGKSVEYFVFTGFEEDARSILNTVEYFRDIPKNSRVQALSNAKFLKETSNIVEAQRAANNKFADIVEIMSGSMLVDSDHNIDDRDLYKINIMTGYKIVDQISLDGVKSVEQSDKLLKDILAESKTLDTAEKSAKRLGVIINANEDMLSNIDTNFTVLTSTLGKPYEVFVQIQYVADRPQSISFIASGLKMPTGEIEAAYEKYVEASNRVNKTGDDFYAKVQDLAGNKEDSMFNTGITGLASVRKDKAAFAKELLRDTGKSVETYRATTKVKPPSKKEADSARKKWIEEVKDM
jgi:cell division GTPase FtsZ